MITLQPIIDAWPFLLQGTGVTLAISIVGMAIGCVLGLLVYLLRVARNPLLAGFARLYVSFFRGVPLLVQLLLFYSFLPFIGIDLPAALSAVLALGLVGAAYIAEILRGAVNAIPRGQSEAAHALGFSPVDLWRSILLPQVLRISTPAMVNELILLLKASSLISVVGLTELTRTAQTFAASTFKPMEFYLAAGAIYLALSFAISSMGHHLERRMLRSA
jgi:polar amino acid transport system permease protein